MGAVCSARHTSPMPPVPTICTSRYGPMVEKELWTEAMLRVLSSEAPVICNPGWGHKQNFGAGNIIKINHGKREERKHSIRGLPLAAVADHRVTIVKVRVLEKLVPKRLVLALTARTWPCKTACHSFQRRREALRVGSWHNRDWQSRSQYLWVVHPRIRPCGEWVWPIHKAVQAHPVNLGFF